MSDKNKKSRLEFLRDIFNDDNKKNIKKNIYPVIKNLNNEDVYYDQYFVDFYRSVLINTDIPHLKLKQGEVPSLDLIFDFFIFCDPSHNKEYVNWFLNLYRNIMKNVSDNIKYKDPQIVEPFLDHITFFEDIFSKVTESLEVFSLLKKTNVLNVENRDINKFKKLNDFINFVKPYMVNNDVNDNEIHTLSFKELKYIQNFTEKNNQPGQAELVYENNEWVIVVTHDRDANVEFGRHTTWCTAGTRYGTSMFDSYNNKGKLFVLIKKGFGSGKLIEKNPNTRLQFHFEDNMYMDAKDKPIDINDFFYTNKDIKNYFRSYISKVAIPKRMGNNTKQKDIIKYLLNLGFGDQIINMMIESKPANVDFSGYKIEDEYLNNIGEISSIEELNLSDCSIEKLPESISKLTKLKKLKIRNNKLLTEIPEWINSLKSLELLDCAGCNIKKIGNIDNCKKLTELVLDFNSNLSKLPNLSGLKKLSRLTASSCNLKNICDDILDCQELFILDVHNNLKLDTIPVELSRLPNIVAICIDDTNISTQTKKIMEKNSNGDVCIIKYGD